MIRILLVDDEKMIRRGLALIIEKLGGEFQVIGEAADGEQALALIGQEHPDIVISDIRMPRMDGLQLSQALDERYPEVRKIILSGFDDFDYARKALRFRAIDYLLKPVDELALLELLKKTAEEIGAEEERRRAALKLQTSHAQNMPLLRDIFLRELVVEGKYRDASAQTLEKNSMACDVRLGSGEKSCRIILVSAGSRTGREAQLGELRRLTADWLAGQPGPDPDLPAGYLLQDGMTLIIVQNLAQQAGMPAEPDGCRSLFDWLRQHQPGSFAVSGGPAVWQMTELNVSYAAARLAQNSHFYGNSPLTWQSGAPANPFNTDLPTGVVENFNNQLVSIHEVLNQQMLTPVIHDFLTTCRDLWIDPAVVRRILEDTYNSLRINNPRFRQAVEDEFGAAWQFVRELNLNLTLADTVDFLIQFLSAVLARMKKNAGRKDKKIIEVVKDYIQTHLQQEITLASLSQIAFISPNYLSEVFKEQTGESMVDYITRLRILKAKDLLKDIRVKVYEVGKLVGYDDPAYFSKVFRKVVGVSPAEYRNLVL